MPVVELTRLDETLHARRALRSQVARLEGELARITASTYPPVAVAAGTPRGGHPRLLDLAALERARDDLAGRVTAAHRRCAEQAASQSEARALLEDMLANPNEHKGAVVTNAQLGLPGCTSYRVVPRLLSTWWRVKVSAGCPLPSAPCPATAKSAARARRRPPRRSLRGRRRARGRASRIAPSRRGIPCRWSRSPCWWASSASRSASSAATRRAGAR